MISDLARKSEPRFVIPSGSSVGVVVFGASEKGEGEGYIGEMGEIGDCGSGTIPVTCLQNVAIARKQYFAGVVKENRTGKTCAASDF